MNGSLFDDSPLDASVVPTAPLRAAAAADAVAPPPPLAGGEKASWMLDPGIVFINHGCFGARLRVVGEAQSEWRRKFESRPVFLLDRHGDDLLAPVKTRLGSFLGMRPDDFGLTTNATDSVNAVLNSVRFPPGAEIVTTSHVYRAVEQAMRHLADRSDVTFRVIDVPIPMTSPQAVSDQIVSALSDRTHLLVVDHVTSQTAVRLPVERIIAACNERGIDVLVDGAHAPGMIPLDVERIGAAYYAGNLHKWVCAPPGAAFLWVRPDRQAVVHPNVISHYLGDGFAAEFAWQGTRDASSWLCVQEAIDAMDALAGAESWPRIMSHNHDLAVWAQRLLSDALGVAPSTPADGSMLGSMASVRIPPALRERFESVDAMHDWIYDEHGIEVPFFEWGPHWLTRVSCQVYNRPGDYERVVEILTSAVER
jgi:isopenicillin-N epimerase